MTRAAASLSATCRAYRLVPTDGGSRLGQVEDVAPAPGPGEVLLRVEAASLNYRDLLILRGQLGAVREGLIPLSDGAGRVVATGREVTRWRVGDRVAPIFYRDWVAGAYREAYGPAALGGGDADGVLADLIAVPEASLVRIPNELSVEEAATLPCAALTAWQALVVRGGIAAGDTLLVQGTGGVALFGLQIARAVGARTIVLSSSDEKRERAEALGAFATVNYRATPDWDVPVRKLTDGLGVSHILELGGPDTFDRSLRALAAGGRIAQIGVFTGFGPRSNLFRLQQINGTIDGVNVGSAEQFEAMNAFLVAHRIKPVIDRSFAFDEAQAAYDELASGRHFGKLVIRL
ncbi:zinc-dependent alcohol dehydrogenase family protein [Methylocystis suflitae]|uniref:zinc-dependent alcohol dehydrogenase family protein n=1 Tax=Methylocystis suflitae TaxID=2951405 RepID=UPI002E1B6FE3